ncbi:MAG: hypothetical protein J0I18_15880 [Actinobacteria bacterium]|nr:hypothetical protein [Actinomycetota bacterium]
MSTPLEDSVLASFLADLTEKGLDEELIKGVGLAFRREKLPSPEAMVELIKKHSGDKVA